MKYSLILALAAAGAIATHAQVQIHFEVIPAGEAEAVAYELRAFTAAATDTLSPCVYLIDWHTALPDSLGSGGWMAYSDGHFWSYRPGKLEEYHFAEDSLPFVGDGVQLRGPFAALLPPMIGRSIEAMKADSACRFTSNILGDYTTIEGTRRVGGCDAQAFRYVLHRGTGLPSEVELVANPGSAAEQTWTARYSYADSVAMPDLSLSGLQRRYPEAFERFSRENFTWRSLVGCRLPRFALPTPERERVVHHAGEGFDRPMVVALLDVDDAASAAVVADLRLRASAEDMGVIYAFTGNDAEAVQALVGRLGDGERAVLNAEGLARDCGVEKLPALIFCDVSGRVISVTVDK